MEHQPHTPSTSTTFPASQQLQMVPNSWHGYGSFSRTPASASSSNNTYLMPTSPVKGRPRGSDSYKPMIARTCGQRPACLVNASVTYCGNNQIYAFGGFDQYTDEGKVAPYWLLTRLIEPTDGVCPQCTIMSSS